MTSPLPVEPPDALPPTPMLRGDRPYTIRVTIICLLVGLLVAIPIGLFLFNQRQTLTVQNGQVGWSFGVFAFPLALLVTGSLLAASVFFLPAFISRRSGRVLDPGLWPAFGVYTLTALLAGAFVLGMILGVI